MSKKWTKVDDAITLMTARITEHVDYPPSSEICNLHKADGRILGQDVMAPVAFPAEDNTAVDGWACDEASALSGILKIQTGRAAAGVPYAGKVEAGSAVRVLTGATIPVGANCVIRDEDAFTEAACLHLKKVPKPGQNCRLAGEDICEGEIAVARGQKIQPQHLARLASLGISNIPVLRPIKVGLFSTGAELLTPGETRTRGGVYDCNRPMLTGLLAHLGCEILDGGILPDDRKHICSEIDKMIGLADAVIVSGGASRGDEDHVAKALVARDRHAVWRLAMKPGRPMAMGLWQDKPLFCLPGNPVAVFVCFLTIARPLLLWLAGVEITEPQPYKARTKQLIKKKAGRREYLRARLDSQGHVETFHSTGSGLISGLQWCRGLVKLDEEVTDLAAGAQVDYIPLSDFGL